MKLSKKISALLLVLVMLVFIIMAAGCGKDSGSSNSSERKAAKDINHIKIGVSIGTLKQERWQREIDMFNDYAKKNGFQLLVQVADDDPQKQVSQCENLINQGVNVLIVQSIDANACDPIVKEAHAAHIPVISYDRFIMNSDLDYYITFDSVKVGEVEAKFIVDKAPKGNYIWLKGGPEDNNAHLVAEGQKKILQPYIDRGDIKVVLEQWCKGWDPDQALKNTENGLTIAQNNIQGIIASNDGTAGGAIQALAAQGLAGKVPIAGQDADLAACQRIVEGTQTGTVYKPIAKLNRAAIELAVALALGKDPKSAIDQGLGEWKTLNNNFKDVPSYFVDVTAIDKSNLYKILIKQDKFQKLADVYKNVPQDQWPKE
ncbi:Hypothetical protein LUCI_3478 [Lucifera butyrica]|uniref:Periplasmic binding protein domain-containing protein n=1 Tax=Lucifera butyrica TaxID=1351585 RepID=A0A498RAJ4_9FIRM|nr:substrate-binding domain-containing protein [Lucifera butyrica]VBB08209.1 Hypothetical protein LUCI_3478 [Lucifera butyrica]